MDKHTIICIVGASGCGKTTLSIILSKYFNIPYICSYTTRQMRDDETNGIEHRFVNIEDMPDPEQMCAYTLFANNHYWTTFDQLNEHPVSTYVIDEKGILYLKEKLKDKPYNLKFIKVYRNNLDSIDIERKNRDADRIYISDDEYDLIIDNNRDLYHMVHQFIKWLRIENIKENHKSTLMGDLLKYKTEK